MLSLFYTTPYKGKVDTIYFHDNKYPYGIATDIYGTVWDISALMGNYICALPVSMKGYNNISLVVLSLG